MPDEENWEAGAEGEWAGDEEGGYWDDDGNWVDTTDGKKMKKKKSRRDSQGDDPTGEKKKKKKRKAEDGDKDEDGGYWDDDGNWVDTTGSAPASPPSKDRASPTDAVPADAPKGSAKGGKASDSKGDDPDVVKGKSGYKSGSKGKGKGDEEGKGKSALPGLQEIEVVKRPSQLRRERGVAKYDEDGNLLPPESRSVKSSIPGHQVQKKEFDREVKNSIFHNAMKKSDSEKSIKSPQVLRTDLIGSPRARAFRRRSPRSAKPELAKWILNPAKLSLHEFLEAQVKLTKSWLVYNRESMKINEDKIARTVLKGLSSQLPHCDHPEPQKAKKKYDTTDKLEFKTPRGPKPNIFSEEERMALLLKPIKRCEPKIWARIQDGLLETFSYYARADVTLDPMLTDEAMYWTSRKQWEMFAQGFDLATVTGISMNDLVEFYGPQREPVDFAYFVELMGEVSVKTLEWWLEKPIDSINVYAEPDGQVALGRMGEILGLCDENKSFRQYLRGRQNIRPIVRGMPRNSDSQAGSFPEGKGYNDGKGKGW